MNKVFGYYDIHMQLSKMPTANVINERVLVRKDGKYQPQSMLANQTAVETLNISTWVGTVMGIKDYSGSHQYKSTAEGRTG